MIYTLQHNVDNPMFDVIGGPVIIEDSAYIGPRAIILPNVRIGYGAVVAAGAVVTKNVPDFTVVAGVPVVVVPERTRDLCYKPDFAMPFQYKCFINLNCAMFRTVYNFSRLNYF
jgi:maltose O-acetyltransferase